MRALAMDLPFVSVGKVISARGKQCDYNRYRGKKLSDNDEARFDLALRGRSSVDIPWQKNHSIDVMAEELHGFIINVGAGSEWLTIGLAQRPDAVMHAYQPYDDDRFKYVYTDRSSGRRSELLWSRKKWKNWCKRQKLGDANPTEERFNQPREIKLKGPKWRGGGFCKTTYASNPDCGGMPNFLRCHISVITLLERIGELPGVKVHINDEGHYGPAYYSDDWREAREAGREPTYVEHPATYSVEVLAKAAGEDTAMLAAFFGALKDALGNRGGQLISEIQAYPDFELREFRGSQDPDLQPFLHALKTVRVPLPESV
jgi:hypothetical protein